MKRGLGRTSTTGLSRAVANKGFSFTVLDDPMAEIEETSKRSSKCFLSSPQTTATTAVSSALSLRNTHGWSRVTATVI